MKRIGILKKLLFFVSLLVYVFVMIVLLFRRGNYGDTISLIEYVKNSANLVPFRTINMYVDAISSGVISYHLIIDNLLGNIILFMPIGIYLPYYFKRITKAHQVLVVTLIIIFVVETTQLITMRGRFDIDDLILNTCGALIGFSVWRTGIVQRIFW